MTLGNHIRGECTNSFSGSAHSWRGDGAEGTGSVISERLSIPSIILPWVFVHSLIVMYILYSPKSVRSTDSFSMRLYCIQCRLLTANFMLIPRLPRTRKAISRQHCQRTLCLTLPPVPHLPLYPLYLSSDLLLLVRNFMALFRRWPEAFDRKAVL